MPGRRWTVEEDQQLMTLLEAGLDADEIAIRIGRGSRTAIYSRIQRLARKRPARFLERTGVAQG